MQVKDLVLQSFERTWSAWDKALEGLTDAEIAARPNRHSNSIGWIAWHMARVEDRWFHSVEGQPQLWETGWAQKLGMPPDPSYAGGGMTPEQVDQFKTPAVQKIKDYAAATRQYTRGYIEKVTPELLDREFTTFYGRRMTVGQLFTHLFSELNQHAGQLAYLKGYFKGYQGRAA